jgi:hypothetical protein
MLLLLILTAALPASAGAVTARWRLGRDVLTLTADPAFAGAISSIEYRGREYLDASDHGREMQGAVQFGRGECLNPTLAGASRDPPGTTTSVLLRQHADANGYRSLTRMAYWDRPGQACMLGPGRKGRAMEPSSLSDLLYALELSPGYRGRAQAVLARVTVTSTEPRPPATVEALTAYLPKAFDTLLVYRDAAGRFAVDHELEDASGERPTPLIVSTADGSAAMGVLALGGEGQASYAGYRGPEVSKWSVVFRAPGPFRPGRHAYVCVWAIGTRREVEAALTGLIGETQPHYSWALAAAVALLLVLLAGWAAWQLRRQDHPAPLKPLGRAE